MDLGEMPGRLLPEVDGVDGEDSVERGVRPGQRAAVARAQFEAPFLDQSARSVGERRDHVLGVVNPGKPCARARLRRALEGTTMTEPDLEDALAPSCRQVTPDLVIQRARLDSHDGAEHPPEQTGWMRRLARDESRSPHGINL